MQYRAPLDCRSSGPGLSPGRGHLLSCVLGQEPNTFTVPLTTQIYESLSANLICFKGGWGGGELVMD